MKRSYKVGFTFGLTTGIITTLGLIVGLNASTHLKLVVVGGILTIAVADSLADSMGIHISEESQKTKNKEVWEATIATFLTKLAFTLTFLIPVLLFNLNTAVILSIIWGMLLLSILSYNIAKEQKKKPWKVIGEHLLIATIVIILTQVLGNLISSYF